MNERGPVVVFVLVPSTMPEVAALFVVVEIQVRDEGAHARVMRTICHRGHGVDTPAQHVAFFQAGFAKGVAHPSATIVGCVLTADKWDTTMRIHQGLIEANVPHSRDFLVCPHAPLMDAPTYDPDPNAALALRLFREGAFRSVYS
jgi:hypothetical protein